MDWQQIGGKIARTGASLLGTAVGGPGAGNALGSIVGSALGVDDATPDNVGAAIDKDPEAAVKLANVQAEHRTRLEKIAAERAVQLEQERTKRIQSAVDDRASARGMSTDDKVPQLILTVLLVFGFFGVIGALALGYFEDAADSQFGVLMAGALTSQFGAALAFWFGSTRDSQRKTEMLRQGK